MFNNGDRVRVLDSAYDEDIRDEMPIIFKGLEGTVIKVKKFNHATIFIVELDTSPHGLSEWSFYVYEIEKI